MIVIFADIACWSFAVGNFACFISYKMFGSGSSGKIINSYNLSPSYDVVGLYKSCNKVASISLIIGGVFAAAAAIIVIVLIKRYKNTNTDDDLNALKPYARQE